MNVMTTHFENSEYPGEIRKVNDLLCVDVKVLGKMNEEKCGKVFMGLRCNM